MSILVKAWTDLGRQLARPGQHLSLSGRVRTSENTCELAPLSLAPTGGMALVVDDNATSRSFLEQTLSGWGMRTHMAGTHAGALEALQALEREGRACEYAIVDSHMPEGDSVGLAASRLEKFPAIRLVVLTSTVRGAGFERFARWELHPMWPSRSVRRSYTPGSSRLQIPARASKRQLARPRRRSTPGVFWWLKTSRQSEGSAAAAAKDGTRSASGGKWAGGG